MIVQIYEIVSTQLHNWTAPSERTTYNATVWTQNGYFVYRPDIVFRPRAPGLSALDCVTSGVKKVLESGMIDAKRVGLVGHSWGGYETTFLLTQSSMFAAGVAGGPHYLKGEPAPEWITQGVTVLERERELKSSGKDTPAAN